MKCLLVGILACLLTLESVHGYKVVCYFTNWGQYRTGAGKFLTSNMDANLCTHIIYAFANLNANSQLAPSQWNDESTASSKGQYELVRSLKKQNPSLKVLLAVGGWSMGSRQFSDMVTNSNLRSNFVKSTVTYLKKHGFDGLDMDWEYPANNAGSRPSDKQLFTVLLKELRSAFGSSLLLTAAVGAGKSTVDSAYEVAKIAPYLDFLNLMTYDFHGSWQTVTGQNAPLYGKSTLNVNYAVNYWINQGFPANKIILGMGTYGRSFTLNDKSKTGIGAPASKAGAAGPFTAAAGTLGYYEICSYLNQGWTRVWDNEQKVPYAYKNDQWVGYDDVQSLTEKVNFLKRYKLGGAMFWSLDTDDFSGKFCNQGKYPLINGVKRLLNANSPATTSTSTRKTTSTSTKKTTSSSTTKRTTKTTTMSGSSGSFSCRTDGLFPNTKNGCKSFFQCLNTGTPNAAMFEQICPSGLLFDKNLKACNWANQVTCS